MKKRGKLDPKDERAKAREAAEQIRKMSKRTTLGGLKTKDLINEGRK
jgi:hypothetical protein